MNACYNRAKQVAELTEIVADPMTVKQQIHVMIVDDHPLFQDGLCNALAAHEDLYVVGTCDNGFDTVQLAQKLQPHVILLDINLPGQNGLQAMRHLQRAMDQAPLFIILTAHYDDEQILQAFGSGAVGFTDKTVHPDRLVEIVRAVVKGYRAVEHQIMSYEEFATWYKSKLQRTSAAAPEAGTALTHREMEILSYLTAGMLNKEIAFELGLSEQTVKNHVTSILRKLNAKDRTQAAVTAIKRGWVRF